MTTSPTAPAARFPAHLSDRYTPLKKLGEGGMGTVYKVRVQATGEVAALKVLKETRNERLRKRFLREAEALTRLTHPNVVRLLDHGVENEEPFLVMELLEGVPLGQRGCPVPPLEGLMRAAEGLEAIHAAGMIHRDVKPSNILALADGQVRVIDLGVVRDADWSTLTAANVGVGTLAYMSPEVLCGKKAGPPADWWAWAVTLYFLCEGRLPLGLAEVQAMAAGEPPPAPKFETLAPDSAEARLIRACLVKDPAARPANVPELRAVTRGETLVRAAPRPSARPLEARAPIGVQLAAPDQGPRPGAVLGVALTCVAFVLVVALPLLRTPAEAPPAPAAAPRDPAAFLRVVAASPPLLEWTDWLAAGGQPETLPSPAQAALQDLDAAFDEARLPPPFGPFLVDPNALGPVSTHPWLTLPGAAELDLPATTRSWMGVASEALEALQEGGPPGDLASLARAAPSEADRTSAWHRARERTAPMARLVYALGRAAQDPAQADLAGALGPEALHAYRDRWFAWFAFLSPEVLLGGPARTPGGWLLLSEACRRAAEVRRQAGQDARALEQRARSAAEEALAGETPHRTSQHRFWRAAERLAADRLRDGEAVGILGLASRVAARQVPSDGWAHLEYLARCIEAWKSLGEVDAGSRDRALDTLRDEGPRHPVPGWRSRLAAAASDLEALGP